MSVSTISPWLVLLLIACMVAHDVRDKIAYAANCLRRAHEYKEGSYAQSYFVRQHGWAHYRIVVDILCGIVLSALVAIVFLR